MKRPLLGIMIVLCLQLAFTAYNAVDRPIESLVAVNEVTSGTNPVVNMPDILSYSDFVLSTPNSRASKRPVQAILVSTKKGVKVPVKTHVKSFPQFVAMQRPLESITITYPRAVIAGSKTEKYQHSAPAVPRSEKRSFVSKSVSVLKKPYTWIKALASRIN